MSVRAGNLTWLILSFVNALLTILKVKTQIIKLKLRNVLGLDHLNVLDFPKTAEIARIKKFKLRIIEKIYTGKSFRSDVYNSDSHKLTVNSMQHVVPSVQFRPHSYLLCTSFKVYVFYYLFVNYPIAFFFLLFDLLLNFFLSSVFWNYLSFLIKNWNLTQKSIILLFASYFLITVYFFLILIVDFK